MPKLIGKIDGFDAYMIFSEKEFADYICIDQYDNIELWVDYSGNTTYTKVVAPKHKFVTKSIKE